MEGGRLGPRLGPAPARLAAKAPAGRAALLGAGGARAEGGQLGRVLRGAGREPAVRGVVVLAEVDPRLLLARRAAEAARRRRGLPRVELASARGPGSVPRRVWGWDGTGRALRGRRWCVPRGLLFSRAGKGGPRACVPTPERSPYACGPGTLKPAEVGRSLKRFFGPWRPHEGDERRVDGTCRPYAPRSTAVVGPGVLRPYRSFWCSAEMKSLR
jgi:hypothetical protein